MTKTIVIDYGVGNVGSLCNGLARANIDYMTLKSGEDGEIHPRAIILPGVGAIGEAMHRIKNSGIASYLERWVIGQKTPFLGICVGMQVLGTVGLEFGRHECLNWIPGTVERIAPVESGIKLPHVGWNSIDVAGGDSVLSDFNGQFMYFTHSYALRCDQQYVAATSDYFNTFPVAVRKDHIYGVQFHPEKSAAVGDRLLKNFIQFADRCSANA